MSVVRCDRHASAVGTAYEYLNLGEADISRSRPLPGTIQGNYSTNEIHFFNARAELEIVSQRGRDDPNER